VSSRLIARRYAKALIEIGTKSGDLTQLQNELDAVAKLVAGNADLKRFVESPLVLPKKKAEVMDAILTQAKASQNLRNFFKVVAEAGRLNLLGTLSSVFHELVDERAGIVVAQVTSAQELSETQKKALEASLAKRTGKTVRLKLAQDASLLGGLKVQLGSTVLDATLQGQLRLLKQQLLTA